MAKSFVLYNDLIHTVKKMPKDKVAKLFLNILNYVNGEEVGNDDLMVDLVFEPIKLQLSRDLGKWDEVRKKRSEAGKKGGINSGKKRREKSEANEANEANASKLKNVELSTSHNSLIDKKSEANEANEANEATRHSNSNSNSNKETKEDIKDINKKEIRSAENKMLLEELKKAEERKPIQKEHQAEIAKQKKKELEQRLIDFDEFWHHYTPIKGSPSKGSKENVKKIYLRILDRLIEHKDIMGGLKKYLNNCKSSGLWTCGAAVFLNQEKWLDEYDFVEADVKQSAINKPQTNYEINKAKIEARREAERNNNLNKIKNVN